MKNTITMFQSMKVKGKKISLLTSYDYSTAKLMDEADINGILLSDSLGNVILGYADTLSVTMEDMIHHGRAVARTCQNIPVVLDMPFLSYQTSVYASVYDTVVNTGRLVKKGRGGCVKPEGSIEVIPQIQAITMLGMYKDLVPKFVKNI